MWGNTGGWNRHELPTLHNYEEAKRRYEETKPIRGRNEDVRPLGKRRTTWMTITKGVSDGGEYYAAKLYETNCIKWYANGNIAIHTGGYPSYTTRDFISFVLPSFFEAKLVRGAIRIHGYKVDKDKGLLLIPTQEQADVKHYKVQDPTQEYTYSINRAKKKAVFSRFSNFRDWFKGYLSLRDSTISVGELGNMHPRAAPMLMHPNPWEKARIPENIKYRQQLLEEITNKEGEIDYAKYLEMAQNIFKVNGRWAISGLNYDIDAFDKLLFKLHAPEILDIKPVAQGTTPPKNSYTRWMNGWITQAYQKETNTNQA